MYILLLIFTYKIKKLNILLQIKQSVIKKTAPILNR